MKKITLGISSCLLGNPVRYDGGHKLDPFLAHTLGAYVDWVPLCPEAACGLPVPREPMHLLGDRGDPRLVTIGTGIDHTARMNRWAKERLAELAQEDLCGFVFKARSPSCAVRDGKIFDANGRNISAGPGLFVQAVRKKFPFLPIEDEDRLHDPAVRESFIVRVFAYRRWQAFTKQDGTLGGLVAFHSDHKYLLLAHSRNHYQALGAMVAKGKSVRRDKLLADYIETMMTGLERPATAKKNTDVLQHLAGYFKKVLSKDEKKELQDVIANYHEGVLPLIVPVTLLNHYAGKYREPYLSRQVFLNPDSLELLLRNHV